MIDRPRQIVLWIAAGAALAVGAAISARALGRRSAIAAELERRAVRLRELERMSKALAAQDHLVAVFERIVSAVPVSLVERARAQWPDRPVAVRELDPAPTLPGWRARRGEITVADVPLEELASFLTAVETGRPPWRLIEGEIRASRRGGAYGDVRLTLECVERAED